MDNGIKSYKCKYDSTRNVVREHKLIAEKILGRVLGFNEVVHHIDGNKHNNKNNNLIIVTRALHNLIHARLRGIEFLGHRDARPCSYCGAYGMPNEMIIGGGNGSSAHKKCKQKYMKQYYRMGRRAA